MKDSSHFVPDDVQRFARDQDAQGGGDNRDGRVYVYHDKNIALAVNVARVTGRPLLLGGPSGCGKSTLARNVALTLGWRYYEHVVTSRTEARDFLFRFDSIRRLNDAQAQDLQEVAAYIEPGVLWWAFDPASAGQRGSQAPLPVERRANDPCEINRESRRAVVLIDEIDKADIDVPNNLLVPLGSLQFNVEPINVKVTAGAAAAPLVFITTNRERELPLAFLRRCVTLDLDKPTEELLVKIAQAHFSDESKATEASPPAAGAADQGVDHEPLFRQIARYVLAQDTPEERTAGLPPSTAEFLDTVRACLTLEIRPDDERFKDLARITLRKRQGVQSMTV